MPPCAQNRESHCSRAKVYARRGPAPERSHEVPARALTAATRQVAALRLVTGQACEGARQRIRVAGIEVRRRIRARLDHARAPSGEHGDAHAHRLERGDAEPLVQGGMDEGQRIGVELRQEGGRWVRLDAHAVPGRPRSAGQHEWRRFRGPAGRRAEAGVGGEEQVEVLARLGVADVQEVTLLRRGSGRGGSS